MKNKQQLLISAISVLVTCGVIFGYHTFKGRRAMKSSESIIVPTTTLINPALLNMSKNSNALVGPSHSGGVQAPTAAPTPDHLTKPVLRPPGLPAAGPHNQLVRSANPQNQEKVDPQDIAARIADFAKVNQEHRVYFALPEKVRLEKAKDNLAFIKRNALKQVLMTVDPLLLSGDNTALSQPGNQLKLEQLRSDTERAKKSK